MIPSRARPVRGAPSSRYLPASPLRKPKPPRSVAPGAPAVTAGRRTLARNLDGRLGRTGGPGLTETVIGLANQWASPQRVLVIEANPLSGERVRLLGNQRTLEGSARRRGSVRYRPTAAPSAGNRPGQ